MTTWARSTDGDIYFRRLGSPIRSLVTDPRQAMQIKLGDRLSLMLGEWVFNVAVGFPWQVYRGQKNPNVSGLRAAIRKYLIATPGIGAVLDVSVAYNAELRDLRYAYEVRLDDRRTLSGGGAVPAPYSADTTSQLGIALSRPGSSLVLGAP